MGYKSTKYDARIPIPRQVQVNITKKNTLDSGSGVRLRETPPNADRHRIEISTAFRLFGRYDITKFKKEKTDWEAMRVSITFFSMVPRHISGD